MFAGSIDRQNSTQKREALGRAPRVSGDTRSVRWGLELKPRGELNLP